MIKYVIFSNLVYFFCSWISIGFSEHVINGDYTLFENLNWLNRNLESILSTPPTTKSVEQTETEMIAAAQQKDLKPPTKKAQSLSISAPVFTPKQQKKASLFDESDDIKKNKVIIVNDPSLIIEQSEEEEEVEVELAEGDGDDHIIIHQEDVEEEGSSSNRVLAGVSQPVIRKGTEIRLVDPKLENISLFKCSLLHIMVKCNRCKDTCEVENIKPDQDEESSKHPQQKKERWMACPTCTSLMGIKFLGGKIRNMGSFEK